MDTLIEKYGNRRLSAPYSSFTSLSGSHLFRERGQERQDGEKRPQLVPAANVVKTEKVDRCTFCHSRGHEEKQCFKKYPNLRTTPRPAKPIGGLFTVKDVIKSM